MADRTVFPTPEWRWPEARPLGKVCAWCDKPPESPLDFAAWPDPTGPVFTVHLACQEAWLAAGCLSPIRWQRGRSTPTWILAFMATLTEVQSWTMRFAPARRTSRG